MSSFMTTLLLVTVVGVLTGAAAYFQHPAPIRENARVVSELEASLVATRPASREQREGLSIADLNELPSVVNDQRMWFNPNLTDTWFMPLSELLEGITLFSILLPAAAMVKEKERGTVEQLLVSPLTPFQIVFPKVLAMSAVILVGVSLSLFAVLGPLFAMPVRGSLGLFYVVTTLYIFTNAGIGLFIAFIGLKNGGVIVANPATFVSHGDFASGPVALATFATGTAAAGAGAPCGAPIGAAAAITCGTA